MGSENIKFTWPFTWPEYFFSKCAANWEWTYLNLHNILRRQKRVCKFKILSCMNMDWRIFSFRHKFLCMKISKFHEMKTWKNILKFQTHFQVVQILTFLSHLLTLKMGQENLKFIIVENQIPAHRPLIAHSSPTHRPFIPDHRWAARRQIILTENYLIVSDLINDTIWGYEELRYTQCYEILREDRHKIGSRCGFIRKPEAPRLFIVSHWAAVFGAARPLTMSSYLCWKNLSHCRDQ